MSTKVEVEISPETTTRPVFTSVSQATRPVGSSRITASRTPSEIWSQILSGWPSVTDSEVNRYSLSESWIEVTSAATRAVLIGREEELRLELIVVAGHDQCRRAELFQIGAQGNEEWVLDQVASAHLAEELIEVEED